MSGKVQKKGQYFQSPPQPFHFPPVATPLGEACPLELSPSSVVVRFGDPVLVNCTPSVGKFKRLGWEATEGEKTLHRYYSTWSVASLKTWSIQPSCFITITGYEDQCEKPLNVTVYKKPDTVSILKANFTGPMVAGGFYKLQCDVRNIAPVRNLSVSWYRGNEIIHNETYDGDIATPQNLLFNHTINPKKDDDGIQVLCKVQMILGFSDESEPYTMSVNCESLSFALSSLSGIYLYIHTKCSTTSHDCYVLNIVLPLDPPSFISPRPETMYLVLDKNPILNCSADGNPSPTYSWSSSADVQEDMGSEAVFRPSSPLPPGNYSCRASNPLASVTKEFTLIKRSSMTLWLIVGLGSALAPVLFGVSGEACSLVLKPSRVVVSFGEPVSVTCEAARPVRVLGWESTVGAAHTQQDLSVQWKVDSLIDWIEEPICYGVFFTAPRQCEEKLNLVLYKTPDSVSIRLVNHTGSMKEGKEYQLLCEVQNIAPVQYLALRWYRDQTEVYYSSFTDLTQSSPVQVSSILLITPTRADNGAQYRCVAELDLGPEGPQPAPTVSSGSLNASVHYPPNFLSPEPEMLDLVVGVEVTLNCSATGYPTPIYSWLSAHTLQETLTDEAVITSSSLLPGTYTCTASNRLDSKSKRFLLKAPSKGRRTASPITSNFI
ncbi:Vascular cell adhesion protein 1 [Merluccius polli]|uniref:Vascular cell adhesion protein 1 n=1 Tax=Merluccius polli TaxID=89951 RepID=A0AA47M7M0_MERPO|nr:Vascular cell adhesion protein 1 [Merluccius polli]